MPGLRAIKGWTDNRETKAVEVPNDVHLSQILTYMKLSGVRVGLFINFNVKHLKEGIRRVIL